jgi:fatty-acyl-CoA synthase
MIRTAHWPPDESVELWELTLGDLLARAAEDAATVPALRSGSDDRTWTYRELWHAASAVAGAVAGMLRPGERLAVWSTGLPEWVLLQFGAAMAGVTLVPLNPVYRASELRYALRQSGAGAVFYGPEVRGRSLREVVELVQPDCPDLTAALPLAELIGWAEGSRRSALPSVAPDAPVMIQYTSGTTGRPKGAVLTHRGIVNNARLSALRAGVADGGVWLNPLPLFHTGGCVFNALGAMATRATHVLMPVWDAGRALELIERERVSFLCSVPTMLIDLIEHPDFGRRDLASLRYVLSGGTTIPPEMVRRFESALGIEYTMVFGQTEGGPTITMTHPHDSPEDKSSTIGQPLPHTEVRILDRDTGRTADVGRTGEICLRGYGRMLEYFDQPDETAAAIEPDGWLHTGDLGQMDERGYLSITGRLKDIIRRGGETISPRAIEDLLFGQPEVAEVAVVGVPDGRFGEQVAAFVVPSPGGQPDLLALRTRVAEHLAPHKVPTFWLVVAEFPRTPSGKVQKFALRDGFAAGEYAAQTLLVGRR